MQRILNLTPHHARRGGADAARASCRLASLRRALPIALAAGLAGITPALAQTPLPEPAQAEPADAGCDEGRRIATGACLATELQVDGFANLRGGVRRGVAAIGRLRIGLGIDLEAAAGLEGWSFEASAFGIFGREPTPTLIGSLAPASNIEALPTFRLNELWLQRTVAGIGSLRFGQLAADTEFATAEAAGSLVNGTFGWPVALAVALPASGPAYPLATPGIRLALGDPEAGPAGLRLGLFSGDPAGRYGPETPPQRHNRYGTIFSFAGGAFMIGEAVVGGVAPGEGDALRPWVLKLGAWYHTGGFDSQRYDAQGLSLADPASSGVPRRFGNNYGGYAVGEVAVWRGEAGSLALFARAFAAPADRNLVSLQLDGGLAWRGPFGRREDTLSLGVSYARIGSGARGLDRDRMAFGEDGVLRTHETVVELNYDLAVVPGRLNLQPIVQWLINPAAGEPDERRSADRPLPDAFLLGMRVTASF